MSDEWRHNRKAGRSRPRLNDDSIASTTDDHVVPVANGGADEAGNLVSSCATCNNGKGAIPLTTTAAAETRRAALAREQDEAVFRDLYNEWIGERRAKLAADLASVEAYWSTNGWHGRLGPTDSARASLRQFCERLGPNELMQAMDIAIARMPLNEPDARWHTQGRKWAAWVAEAERRFRYLCGICHRWMRGDR